MDYYYAIENEKFENDVKKIRRICKNVHYPDFGKFCVYGLLPYEYYDPKLWCLAYITDKEFTDRIENLKKYIIENYKTIYIDLLCEIFKNDIDFLETIRRDVLNDEINIEQFPENIQAIILGLN